MLTFAGAVRAIDEFLQTKAPSAGKTLDFHTPVKFDPALLPRLRAAHEALNSRFAALLCLIDHDDAGAAEIARQCLKQFQELRRAESIWLYPVLARVVDQDDAARGRLMELRLVTLTLARRILRSFDALVRAIDAGSLTRASVVADVSGALAQYMDRSVREIYPLYMVISLLPAGHRAHAA